MWRNIIGQSLYQAIILTIFLFTAPLFIPGVTAKDSSYEGSWTEDAPGSKLFTMFFNTFVFLQIFNEINARKIKAREFNIFKGICNNWLFFFIEILTIIVQVLLVQFSGYAVKCTPLNWWEYLICIGIGMFGLVIGLLVKLLPLKLFSVKIKE